MIYSFTTASAHYAKLTNDTTGDNTSEGMDNMNAEIGRVLGLRPWPFLYREGTVETVSSTQFVEVPGNLQKVTSVRVTSGTTIHTPAEVPNRQFWDRLNSSTSVESTFPDWYYVFNGRVHFWPIPSTARTVTIFGRIGFNRLNIQDYSTGAITTTTQGGTAIVGTTSTAWTESLVGRSIRITASNDPPDKTGDDEWYELASFTGGSAMSLVKPYRGISLSVATAPYVMGQTIPLPDGYQEIPIYWAAYLYWASTTIQGSDRKAQEFKGLHRERLAELISNHASETDNVMIEDESLDEQLNPNLIVRL